MVCKAVAEAVFSGSGPSLVNKFKMIIQYELNQYFMYVGSQYILLEGDLLQSIYSLIAAMYLGL